MQRFPNILREKTTRIFSDIAELLRSKDYEYQAFLYEKLMPADDCHDLLELCWRLTDEYLALSGREECYPIFLGDVVWIAATPLMPQLMVQDEAIYWASVTTRTSPNLRLPVSFLFHVGATSKTRLRRLCVSRRNGLASKGKRTQVREPQRTLAHGRKFSAASAWEFRTTTDWAPDCTKELSGVGPRRKRVMRPFPMDGCQVMKGSTG